MFISFLGLWKEEELGSGLNFSTISGRFLVTFLSFMVTCEEEVNGNSDKLK